MQYLVFYADSTAKSDEFDHYFQQEGHITQKYGHIEEIVDFLNNTMMNENISKIVLIWHLTSSCFEDEDIENDDDLNRAVQYFKDNTLLDFKLGISDNHSFYSTAKNISWFDLADSWYELRNLFKVSNGYSLEEGLRNLPLKKNRENVEQVIYYLLHLFLPLDIDMQALQTAEDKKSYLNNMHTDLDELYKKDGGIDEHYRRKLYSLWHLLGASLKRNQIPLPEDKEPAPINNPSNDLLKLAGLDSGSPEESAIYEFLKVLDKRKKDMDDLYKSFNNLKVNDEEITSFPKWYRALAEELRKLSA